MFVTTVDCGATQGSKKANNPRKLLAWRQNEAGRCVEGLRPLTACEQAEMILYAALDPAVAGKARQGDFVRCVDDFNQLQSLMCDPLAERRCTLPGKPRGQRAL